MSGLKMNRSRFCAVTLKNQEKDPGIRIENQKTLEPALGNQDL